MMLRLKNLIFAFVLLSLAVYGCGGGCGKSNKQNGNDSAQDVDSNATTIFKVGDALFSVPSPFLASMLIKENNFSYDKEMLNNPKVVANYSTNFQKALNMGVYGADLGYATIYEQPQDAIKYFESVEELANELGISSAFDSKTINKIKQNIGNRDSLLNIVSVAYRASDEYLKNNARTDISALILAGGWVESTNFMVTYAKKKNNQELINRIGEQKNPLENLIKILTPHYNQPEYTEMIDNLIDLAYEFDGVDIKYNYVKPIVDVQNKTTYINSTSQVVISTDQLGSISQKIQILRKKIIENKFVKTNKSNS